MTSAGSRTYGRSRGGYVAAAVLLTLAVGPWVGAAPATADTSGNHDARSPASASTDHGSGRHHAGRRAQEVSTEHSSKSPGATATPRPTRACQPTRTPTPTTSAPATPTPTSATTPPTITSSPTPTMTPTATAATSLPANATTTAPVTPTTTATTSGATTAPTSSRTQTTQSPGASLTPSQETSVLATKIGSSGGPGGLTSGGVLPRTGGPELISWSAISLGLLLAGLTLLVLGRKGGLVTVRGH
jgi:hypothetical protein